MLAITSMSCIGPWGESLESFIGYCTDQSTARSSRQAEVAPVPGFIESNFNPLVYRTLQYHMESGCIRDNAKLAIVLGSEFGDTVTADLASRNLLAGKTRNPLLFYQSVPNSILGYASSRFQFTEMITCMTYDGGSAVALLEMADLYLTMPEVDQVLLIGVETQSDRADEMYAKLAMSDEQAVSRDTVVSLLMEKSSSFQSVVDSASSDEPVICVESIVQLEHGEEHQGAAACSVKFIGNEGLLNLVLAVQQLMERDEPGMSARTVSDVTFGGDCYAITIVRRPQLV